MQVNNRVLFLGIGNYLMGDEGIGVHVAQRMAAAVPTPRLDILDGGTGGFYLLEYFEQYDEVIIVDATLDRRKPGTIRHITPRFASDFPQAMSTHDIGLKDLVGALQLLGRMPVIHLLVVSIETVQQQGTALTNELEAVVPELMKRVSAFAAAMDDGVQNQLPLRLTGT
ncbi:hydrogenase maturation protease [Niastella koreensis]|uniref:Hydrogenase maturation protease n=2 Tax=Niastella koreensis TaxID=354356 RepID=G8TKH6_NIAKG|nr:hydrogenase maturation protease [Niastella koreensis]AEV97632.1 hydrogenase maturation protease [Niastella koreensis GR20-10]OQP40543.1 hydrogenase maturation protease [Niastella koreensis]